MTRQTVVGSGGGLSSFFGGGGSNTATFALTADTSADQTAFEQALRDKINSIKNVGTLTESASSGGFSGSNLEVDVKASDDATLRSAPSR
ncbi:hypothetical protein KDK_76320 [Dictyobacter kobayashii]|uniref:Uncharacterized protein n=1 Tax=Dictyobacter kobayashii TaxID=2014872 RepID=A0A402AXJ2_9CHLR|nr:hypothetical protein [Dictyobacter kobayashii]GCE23832.1 hypothetical protein KDK_76320 [Dictyobacter kobayashii]